jgi:general stress protein 26
VLNVPLNVINLLKNLADVARFMENEWLASFATVDAEGKPHVVPVWFTYEKNLVHVQTDRKSAKVRNLKQNSNIAVTVYRGEEAVLIRGVGKIIADEKEFVRLTQFHIDKYNRLFNAASGTKGVEYIKLDKHGRDNMGIPLFDSKIRCIIEVKLEKILFW